MFSLCAQSTFEQSLAINSTGADPCTDCVIDIQSNSKVMQVPNLNTTERNNLGNPIPGMMIYNSDSLSLQGYLPEATLVEPDTTYLYSNGSDNIFASTVIIYTPSSDGSINFFDIGISSANANTPHRLTISTIKPCSGGANIAKPLNKSNTTAYTDYTTLQAGTKNRYNFSIPYVVTAGTKYYIYPDAMTNTAGARIYWSNNTIEDSPVLSSIFSTAVCTEVNSDLDIKVNLTTDFAGWVNLTD